MAWKMEFRRPCLSGFMIVIVMMRSFVITRLAMTVAAWTSSSSKTARNHFFIEKTNSIQHPVASSIGNPWKGPTLLFASAENKNDDMTIQSLSDDTLDEMEEEITQIVQGEENSDDEDGDEIIDLSEHLQEFKKEYFQGEEAKREESENQASKRRSHKKKKKKQPTKTKREIKKYTYMLHQRVEELLQKGFVEEAIEKAEDNIQKLQSLYWETGIRWYKPNIHTYNVYIRAVSQKQPDGPQRAELILKTLPIPPNVGTYTIVISAHASATTSNNNEKSINAAEKAQQLLYELMDLMQQQDDTAISSNTVSQDLKQNENNEEEEEEEDDDDDDEEDKKRESFVPEGDLSVACDAVLNVWAKRGTSEAAERCEAILERMEYLRRKSTLQVQPTTFSFATVMKAWANAKDVNGTERAERTEYILQQLLAAYQDKNKNDMDLVIISPDTVVFNSVIDAWAKSGDPRSGAKGEALFKQMLDLSSNKNKGRGNKTILSCRPDIITYNSLINCWSNSGHMNAAKESERILKGMEKQLKALTMKKNNDTTTSKKANKNDNGDGDGDDDEIVAPNRRTYNSVLKAYAKSRLPGAPKRAFAILNYMLQAGRKEIQPDVISFTTVLDVWAKSKEENKAAQAQAILQKMNQFYMQTGDVSLRPNAVTYNAVLNACAFSAMTSDEERKQALKVALSTFQEMQQSSSASNTKTKGNGDAIRADSITYGTLLKCMANLIPSGNPSRTKMSCNLFEKCCTEGLVGEMAWNEFRRSVSRKTLAEVLSQNNKMDIRNRSVANIQVKDLPKDWTCNVFEAKTYRSNRHHDRKGSVDKKGGRRGRRSNGSKKKESSTGTEDEAPKLIRPMRTITETSWIMGKDI